MAATVRLFVALWPTEETRDRVATIQRTRGWPADCLVVAPPDLHITLAFIGAIPIERVGLAGSAAAVPSADVTLSLERIEVWKGGTVVLTPRRVPAALVELHQRLTASLRAAGVPVDETYATFAPHVTLARRARGVAPGELTPLSWQSNGHVLAVSAGGRYQVAARFG